LEQVSDASSLNLPDGQLEHESEAAALYVPPTQALQVADTDVLAE
jgi:hypothetical protein